MFKALLGLPDRQALLALLGQRDRKAMLDPPVLLELHQLLRGLQGLLAQQEIQALLVHKETRDLLDRKASRVFRAFKEMLAPRAQPARRVTPAQLALLVRLVLKGLLAPPDLPDRLVPKAQLGQLVRKAMLAPQAPQVLLAPLVLLVLLVLPVLKVMLGLQGLKAFRVSRVSKAMLVLLAPQVLADQLALRDPRAPNRRLLDPQGLLDQRVVPVRLVQQALKVMLVLLDPRAV